MATTNTAEIREFGIPVALTPHEAHKLLGVGVISRASFYAAINRKEVPHVRLGRRILIPRKAFERWLECRASVAA